MKTETTEETCCECSAALEKVVNTLGRLIELVAKHQEILQIHEETLKKHSELLNGTDQKKIRKMLEAAWRSAFAERPLDRNLMKHWRDELVKAWNTEPLLPSEEGGAK